MPADKEFADGIYVKAPHENAPDFVKFRISLKREDVIQWLSKKDGECINLDVKESQGGKWYCQVDTWEPKQKPSAKKLTGPDDDLPY